MQIRFFNIPISDNGVMLADCKKDLAYSLKGKDMKELRWVTTNKHNSPAADATQGYMCLFASVMPQNKI